MSQQSAINQAQSDHRNGSGCSNTNGWSSQDRETYNAELNRLKQEAVTDSSKK